jgi:hypothetical protein
MMLERLMTRFQAHTGASLEVALQSGLRAAGKFRCDQILDHGSSARPRQTKMLKKSEQAREKRGFKNDVSIPRASKL